MSNWYATMKEQKCEHGERLRRAARERRAKELPSWRVQARSRDLDWGLDPLTVSVIWTGLLAVLVLVLQVS